MNSIPTCGCHAAAERCVPQLPVRTNLQLFAGCQTLNPDDLTIVIDALSAPGKANNPLLKWSN